MKKKITTPKAPKPLDIRSFVEKALTVNGLFVPNEIAELAYTFYNAFLRKGFSTEQAFVLTQQLMSFFLRDTKKCNL